MLFLKQIHPKPRALREKETAHQKKKKFFYKLYTFLRIT